MIYDIQITLDFSGKKNITEKIDKDLPDISINFKTHPIVNYYNQINFKQSTDALKYINENIDSEYKFDKNSNVCLFELGYRGLKDDRLEFENFVMNFQQVQKSYQIDYLKQDLSFDARLR